MHYGRSNDSGHPAASVPRLFRRKPVCWQKEDTKKIVVIGAVTADELAGVLNAG